MNTKTLKEEIRLWLSSMSLNEMKELGGKYKTFNSMPTASDWIRIYKAEAAQKDLNIYNKLMGEAVYVGQQRYKHASRDWQGFDVKIDKLGEVMYFFDGDKNEIGFCPIGLPKFAIEMRGRVWGDEMIGSVEFTKIK